MTSSVELLRQGRTEELWSRYLGFLELNMDQFMEIQKRKVMEHVDWLARSPLGQDIIGTSVPTSVDEFREKVPLTTYDCYASHLLERSSESLPEEPICWLRTSGRGGEYQTKWVPIFREAWDQNVRRNCVGVMALAASRSRGDFRLAAGHKLPYMWAPAPFPMDAMATAVAEEIPIEIMPPREQAAGMNFQERVDAAMQISFRQGMDHFFGLSSVLLKIGERFAEQSSQKRKMSRDMIHPKVIFRLMRGMIRSKIAGRPMYPKDLWNVKGICAGGTDTTVFAERINKYWGVRPCEMYGAAEFSIIGVQTWDRKALTPLPDVCFFEFIPLEESQRTRSEPGFSPKTILFDEVKAGETYELVLTSLKLTPMTRYRIGDLVRIESLTHDEYQINLPQMIVLGRCDDVIDLAGFTRLSERTVWYAIEKSGIQYEEWICRKEVENGSAVLRIWLEPKGNGLSTEEVKRAIHHSLMEMDSDYRDLPEMLGYDPLRVDLLAPGTFNRYMLNRQAAGAEPAHFKPKHFVSSDSLLDLVLSMDAEARKAAI